MALPRSLIMVLLESNPWLKKPPNKEIKMQLYEVSYEVLTEARTDTYLGMGSTQLQNLRMTVMAMNPGQAQEMVQAMNGGFAHCRTFSAYPV